MGGLFLTASELNINQDRRSRQTLCAGRAEPLLTHCWERRAALGSHCPAQLCSGGGSLHINICPAYKEGSGQAAKLAATSILQMQGDNCPGRSGWLSSPAPGRGAQQAVMPSLRHTALLVQHRHCHSPAVHPLLQHQEGCSRLPGLLLVIIHAVL